MNVRLTGQKDGCGLSSMSDRYGNQGWKPIINSSQGTLNKRGHHDLRAVGPELLYVTWVCASSSATHRCQIFYSHLFFYDLTENHQEEEGRT